MVSVDFALITVRQDEYEAVLQRFPTTPLRGSGGRLYGLSHLTTRTGKTCLVAVTRCPEMANDVAQQVANDMIRDLDPQMLLVVGIAGGVPDDEFSLGDVIISSRINNFNVSKRLENGGEEFDLRGAIHPGVSNIVANLSLYRNVLAGWNTPESLTMPSPKVDLQQFETEAFQARLADTQQNADWYRKLRDSLVNRFQAADTTHTPIFQTGTISSSNSVLRSVDAMIRLAQNARSTLAVEMESAGIYQATQGVERQYPFMAIRGISDIIGLNRERSWTKYACQTAAAFAYAFVRSDILSPRAQAAPAEDTLSEPFFRPPTSGPSFADVPAGEAPIRVFISYSERDQDAKEALGKHLAMLQRDGLIWSWDSRQLSLGQQRSEEAVNYMNAAQLVLLLVSSDFLASPQLYEREVVYAMERSRSHGTCVVPILLRPVELGNAPFKDLVMLPRNGVPVEKWSNRDSAWYEVAKDIRNVCQKLRGELTA